MSLINISNFTFYYEGNSENVNIQLDTDWKLDFVIRNGKGKTTLMKLIASELQGTGTILSNVDFEYFPYSISNPEMFIIDIIMEIAINAEDWEIYREMSLLKIDKYIDYK